MNEFDDPFGLHRQSRPSDRVDQDGREIRLLGRPILGRDLATNDLAVPAHYSEHPHIVGRHFYTLPRHIIDRLVSEVGVERFDAELLAMERDLSNVNGDHSSSVGVWDGAVIPYAELAANDLPAPSEDVVRNAGMDPAKVDLAMRVHRERDVAPLVRFSMGYCGWLMTNRQFLDEHDRLLADHADTVRRWGTQHAATFLPESIRAALIPGTDPNTDPSWQHFIDDCNPFLLRWRLAGLAGPYLPIPSKPLMAGVFPISVVHRLMDAGGIFYLPDTMPTPSRDQLRGMLDHALHRGETPEHIREWLEIVRADNMAKNRMDPYGRQFQLQHYWRILYERHATAINRKIGKLEAAFGCVFKVSSQQIRKDLNQIRERLDVDWLDRQSPILFETR